MANPKGGHERCSTCRRCRQSRICRHGALGIGNKAKFLCMPTWTMPTWTMPHAQCPMRVYMFIFLYALCPYTQSQSNIF
ncbi:MAG: hypothetical protein KME31_07340 [Tolypothrix carrinoi HA7290-LM1]|nr:hypothetical protein [Tolypothrix carrinoi HA7290-LM1]